jgi:pimeloyl-ACP methyl ester carboxylesterase
LAFGFFRSHELDWLFKRTLAVMSERAAEVGECLAACARVRERDPDSWVAAWAELGERVLSQAEESEQGGHAVSARESYFRAATYFRTAEYLAARNDTRAFSLWKASRDAFIRGGAIGSPAVQPVTVPFEGCELPAYFVRAEGPGDSHPTLFSVGGNDDSLEESFLWNGFAAARRGYNYFTFDYPGHRGAVHLYPGRMLKRADQEKPFAAALDVLSGLPGVNDQIAIAGHSGGGYVVARVAAHDSRVRALIASTPLVDAERAGKAFFRAAQAPDWLLRMLINIKKRSDPAVGRLLEYTLWTVGVSDAADIKRYITDPNRERMTIAGIEHQITCPVLAMLGSGEGPDLQSQTREFLDAVGSTTKTLYEFSPAVDGSDDHCQLDNRTRANIVMFDWLDEVFGGTLVVP